MKRTFTCNRIVDIREKANIGELAQLQGRIYSKFPILLCHIYIKVVVS